MFVIFWLLFGAGMCLNLPRFKSFQIDFAGNCTVYLLLQNKSNYMSLFQKDNQLQLWVTQNVAYEIYTAAYTDNFTFDWPAKLINGVEMGLVLRDGSIKYPLDFDNENVMCSVKGVNAINEENPKEVFKCLPSKEWIIKVLSVVIVALLGMLLGVQHESIKIILGPKISRIVWRVRKILSRSEEEISSCNSNTNSEISEIAERLHTPQTNTKTTKV